MKHAFPILVSLAFLNMASGGELTIRGMAQKEADSMKTLTLEIIHLAKDPKMDLLAAKIRPAEESGRQRHAASAQSVKNAFEKVDPSKIEFGVIAKESDGSILVRIISPIRIDLDFANEPDPIKAPRLEGIHP